MLIAGATTHAQTLQYEPELVVIRNQFRSIAEEALGTFDPDSIGEFSLIVESERFRSVVENAFIQALTARGKTVRLSGNDGGEEDIVVNVVVLSLGTEYDPLAGGFVERHIETTAETRFELVSNREILHRAILQRSHVDTVQTGETANHERPSLLERLAEPAVVISGAVLIVYLLFTVRS